jgi:hypothetical protein
MIFGARDKTEHSHERPSQHAGLFSGQGRNDLAPTLEAVPQGFRAIQEIVGPFCEEARAFRLSNGIPDGHFFKGKEEVSARLDTDSAVGYFGELAFPQ